MISTHTPKMFNARMRVNALSAVLSGVPEHYLCSQTTNMRRHLFAAPHNAAEMRIWREKVAKLPKDFPAETVLPKLTDPQLKQLLLPIDWRADDYVCVTPVTSMGVTHELYQRIYEQRLPYSKYVVQPTPSAVSNHGEALMLQSGKVLMLRRGLAQIDAGNWRGDFVQLTARCEQINITSGMIAKGFPALTAVGGFIHAIERKLGHDIRFAMGFKSMEWIDGRAKLTNHKTAIGISPGGVRMKSKTTSPVPGFQSDEVKGNCELVLLMQSDANHQALADALSGFHRLAGGQLWDIEISIKKDSEAPTASYLIDASADIIRERKKKQCDSMQAALNLYAKDGEWRDGKWWQYRNGYTLNHTGYAFLEQPTEKNGVRSNYKHAWAEPTFSLITQGSMTDDCWWKKKADSTGVYWSGEAACSAE